MLVADIMTTPARTVTPEMTVKEALRLLHELRVTALPVLDERERLVGIVSEADLLRDGVPHDSRAVLRRVRDPEPEPPGTVGAVMTRAVRTAAPGDDVADIAQTMVTTDIKSMPVLWGARVVGVVSRSDVVARLARPDADLRKDVATALRAQELNAWHFVIDDGRARVWGGPHGECRLVEATVRAVPGVRHVEVRHETRPWDDGTW
ncbi:HPP family protein [Puerhibacterium sp. TATVAM-FAB25]|uniref:CBS domain-containing protein n=1 Tax=Puerhibacterium sp. TATVAM-FAB25 TaxID=3093699 RepID=UPI00397D5153